MVDQGIPLLCGQGQWRHPYILKRVFWQILRNKEQNSMSTSARYTVRND